MAKSLINHMLYLHNHFKLTHLNLNLDNIVVLGQLIKMKDITTNGEVDPSNAIFYPPPHR